MIIFKIATDGSYGKKEITETLEGMQREVNGFIEVIHITNSIDLIINEEGAIQEQNANFKIKTKTGSQIIRGDAFFISHDDEDFASLNEEQLVAVADSYDVINGTMDIAQLHSLV